MGRPVVSSLSERGGREEEPEPGEEGEGAGAGAGAGEEAGKSSAATPKPLALQSSATSAGSSIASLPDPETKVIPGGGSEASGLPFRKESRPESGDGGGEEEEEEEEEVEEARESSPRRIVLGMRTNAWNEGPQLRHRGA